MKQFLKYTFAAMLGFLISAFIIIFFFFIFTFAIISSLDSAETVTISENTVLEIRLDYKVPERTNTKPSMGLSLLPSLRKTIGLNDIVRIINNAKVDNRVNGIFLDLDNLYVGGLSKINTIREALIDFKTSDKFIVAHGNTINERAYYLASVADSIFLTSTGGLEFDGFGIEVAFFKEALDKLDIEPQIFQYGKFKSDTEPFRLSKFSDENRIQLNMYLHSVYDNFLLNISSEMKIEINQLKNIADNLKVNSSESALELGLVNDLLYDDQVDSIIINLLDSTETKLNKISAKKYLHSMNGSSTASRDRIAVIYALGEIVNSKGDEFSIGTKNIIRSIKKAKENSRVKAIVMRVNSPGGSPLTSDMIWREIELASEVKPFIVSMGDIAASGGYYISCNADKIVAEPNTLAGSIGVYGIIPNTQKFFNRKLGITFDRVETSENSSLITLTTPLSKKQKKYINTQIDNIYFDFVNRVADGRNMTFEEVDEIAQGRIWSGIDAKNIGLVDTLGNLELALNLAAESANIEEYRIVEYPTQKEPFEKIMELLSSEIKSNFSNIGFDKQLNQINKLAEALKYTGIQARLPFEYKINWFIKWWRI